MNLPSALRYRNKSLCYSQRMLLLRNLAMSQRSSRSPLLRTSYCGCLRHHSEPIKIIHSTIIEIGSTHQSIPRLNCLDINSSDSDRGCCHQHHDYEKILIVFLMYLAIYDIIILYLYSAYFHKDSLSFKNTNSNHFRQ